MSDGPKIVHRTEQPYVGIRETITMSTFNVVADRIPELFAWLAARGLAPAGAPFFKYNVIDMERELEVEVGIPIATAVEPDGDVLYGTLPAGRYVAFTSVGSSDDHIAAVADMFDWAAELELTFDMSDTDAGSTWACRLQVLNTEPALEPDVTKHETENLFRLAD